jgi:nucleotide-binding universal stress UspA family protein
MTYFVAFDGTRLSVAALRRAAAYADAIDEPLRVATVVPVDDAEYAREHGWLDEDEPFDADAVSESIEAAVTAVAPEAGFHLATVDRFAPEGAIAERLRERAREVGAGVVFLGSDNAGHVVSGVASVGQRVAAGEDTYDVHIVRHAPEA